ncbi:hypothetical protein CSA80_03840 [Candidatus Saccharibacteria bacterium]|nr:MAG: hypothetical protein CSA80_03840 [Candidatus Saccharibacteria bacterium]
MDIRNFKHVDLDDENGLPEWLRDTNSAPSRHGKSPRKKQTRTKPTEDFVSFRSEKVPHNKAERAQKVQEQPREAPAVSIQISMPSFRPPKLAIPWRRLRPWVIAITLLGVGIIGGKMLLSLTQQQPVKEKVPTIVQAELGFRPLAVLGASDDSSNAKRPAYDEERKLYTFYHTFKGAHITVDQQPVPEKLKDNKAAVRELARNIGADEQVATSLGTLYLSSSEDAAGQRLMLVNNKMLMFIQSTKAFSNADWVAYIQDLE